MNNYSKIITFFLENGIQLSKDQIESLKETTLTKFTDKVGNTIIRNAPKGKEYLVLKGENDGKKQKVIEKDKEGNYTDKYMNSKDAEFIISKANEENKNKQVVKEGALRKLMINRSNKAEELSKDMNGTIREKKRAEEEYLEKLPKIGDQSSNDIMKNYAFAINNTSTEGIEKARENIRQAKKDLSNNNIK